MLFRLLRDDDLPLIARWLAAPHVAAVWHADPPFETPYDEIAAFVEDPGFELYAMLWEGRPVGYVQTYPAAPDHAAYGLAEGAGVWGTDQFIGEAECVGRGVGTAVLKALTRHLLARPEIATLVTDPSPDNNRARRCYEKVGFQEIADHRTEAGNRLMWLGRPVQPLG